MKELDNLEKATRHIRVIYNHLENTRGQDSLEKVIDEINQILKNHKFLTSEDLKDLFELIIFINQYHRYPLGNLLFQMKD